MKTRFGAFTVDSDTRQLIENGADIHLSPKAFDLLTILLDHRPKVLSKNDLQQRLWPNTFVAEANLANLIAELRGALRDPARTPMFIRTAHGFGYAFCGEASAISDARSMDVDRPTCWLEWGGRRLPLALGENVLGRDPDVEVPLDASTVSRRHARVIVTPDGATLDDLGSKNGTFHGDVRVTVPVALADGDTIGIGSLRVTFHRRPELRSTETSA